MRRGGEEDQSVEKLDEIRNEGQRDKVPFVSLDYDYLEVTHETRPPPRPSMTTALRRRPDDSFTEANQQPLIASLWSFPCAAPLAATLLLKQTRGLLEQTTKRQRKVEFWNKQVNNK